MNAQETPRPNVRTTDGHAGTTQAMPDERVVVTLDDGRTIVIDADRLQPQADGSYLIALTTGM